MSEYSVSKAICFNVEAYGVFGYKLGWLKPFVRLNGPFPAAV